MQEAYGEPLNSYVFQIRERIHKRRVTGVSGLQDHCTAVDMHALQGRFSVDAHGGNLPVLYGRLPAERPRRFRTVPGT